MEKSLGSCTKLRVRRNGKVKGGGCSLSAHLILLRACCKQEKGNSSLFLAVFYMKQVKSVLLTMVLKISKKFCHETIVNVMTIKSLRSSELDVTPIKTEGSMF